MCHSQYRPYSISPWQTATPPLSASSPAAPTHTKLTSTAPSSRTLPAALAKMMSLSYRSRPGPSPTVPRRGPRPRTLRPVFGPLFRFAYADSVLLYVAIPVNSIHHIIFSPSGPPLPPSPDRLQSHFEQCRCPLMYFSVLVLGLLLLSRVAVVSAVASPLH